MTLNLFREAAIIGVLSGNMLLKAHHHYLITGNVTIPSNVTVTLNEGAVIRFEGFFSVEVFGNLLIKGTTQHFIKFTTNSPIPLQGDWRFIRFNNTQNGVIKHALFEYATDGLRIENNTSMIIENCYFNKNKTNAWTISQSDNSTLQNCMTINSNQGGRVQFSNNCKLVKTIFYNNEQGLHIMGSDLKFNNNYVYLNQTGVFCQFRPSAEIMHNEFINNLHGSFCAGSDPFIKTTNFTGNNIAINIGIAYNSVNSNPTLNDNNFIGNSTAVRMRGFAEGLNTIDINASLNWWNTTSTNIIDDLIFDKKDSGEDSVFTGNVIYQPFKLSRINSSGIEN